MSGTRSNAAMFYVAAASILVWFALLLQFYLQITLAETRGVPVVAAIINYFSFFTILTNILVALVLTLSWCMPDSNWGSLSSRPVVQAGVAVYITVVGAGYSLLLRHLWNPEGMQKMADILLHDVVPVTYVAYWLIFAPKGGLRWKSVLLWLIYPLAYLSYTLLRGALSGWYPYPFLDVSQFGYARVLTNAAMLMIAFLGIGLLVLAIGRGIARHQSAARPQNG